MIEYLLVILASIALVGAIVLSSIALGLATLLLYLFAMLVDWNRSGLKKNLTKE